MKNSLIYLFVATLGIAAIVYYFKPEWFVKSNGSASSIPPLLTKTFTQVDADKLISEIIIIEGWKFNSDGSYSVSPGVIANEQRKVLKDNGFVVTSDNTRIIAKPLLSELQAQTIADNIIQAEGWGFNGRPLTPTAGRLLRLSLKEGGWAFKVDSSDPLKIKLKAIVTKIA